MHLQITHYDRDTDWAWVSVVLVCDNGVKSYFNLGTALRDLPIGVVLFYNLHKLNNNDDPFGGPEPEGPCGPVCEVACGCYLNK